MSKMREREREREKERERVVIGLLSCPFIGFIPLSQSTGNESDNTSWISCFKAIFVAQIFFEKVISNNWEN